MILVLIAFALGGILKGATGAGAPIIAVPVMTLFFGAPFAVAVFSIPNLVTNIWQGWHYRQHRLTGPLTLHFALAGALGAGLGSFMLAWLPTEALNLTVALSVLAYVGFRALRPGWRLGLDRAEKLAAPMGILGGILQGAAGLSAPVSLSFLNELKLERPQFIVTISVFFFAMALVQIPPAGRAWHPDRRAFSAQLSCPDPLDGGHAAWGVAGTARVGRDLRPGDPRAAVAAVAATDLAGGHRLMPAGRA